MNLKYKQIYIIGGNGVMGQLITHRMSVACKDKFPKSPILYDKDDVLQFEDGTKEEPIFIIVSVPITEIDATLKRIFELSPKNCFITEIGSVKGYLVEKYYNILSSRQNGSIFFNSFHPMCGPLADWQIMDWNKKCLAVEYKNFPIYKPLIDFWESLNFTVKNINNEEHNKIIGKISHLSHFMILKYVEFIEKTCKKEELELAGTSWETFKRMANGAS